MIKQGKAQEFLESIYEKSPELRHTNGNFFDEAVRQSLRRREPSFVKNKKAHEAWNRYLDIIDKGYKGYSFFDNWTKCLVFDAVYQSRLEDGYSEEEAIRLANRAVQDTQPASTAREAPRMFRTGNDYKLFVTQFMGSLREEN